MSAMSAPSAAPASLMPLSLIAEHKSAQPPPTVPSLQRTGSEKCTQGSIVKPTANGMEGTGPLPPMSQNPQSLSAVPEISSQHNANSASSSSESSNQLPVTSYQPPHPNTGKQTDILPSSQEGNGSPLPGSVPSLLSGDKRIIEDSGAHHQAASTTFPVTNTSSVEQHSRSSIPAQLLQLQPSQPVTHHITPPNNTPADPLASNVQGNSSGNTPTISTSSSSPEEPSEESTPSVAELPQVSSTELTSPSKSASQVSTGDSISTLQTSSLQSCSTGQAQTSTLPVVNSSPKSMQAVQPNVGTVSTTSSAPNLSQPEQTVSSTNISAIVTAGGQTQSSSAENTSLKVATVTKPISKRGPKVTSPGTPVESKKSSVAESIKEKESHVGDKPRRKRLPTQPYQSPIPELNIMAKYKKMKEMNEKDKEEKKSSNSSTDKLIVFYRNEFLAVRNAEGSFYVCQAMQNVYKSSSRIRIRWLSQQPDPTSDLYTPDFYDLTEFDCILTNLNLERVEKNKFRLPEAENRRTESILQRALDVESGAAPPPADDTLTETHPDGLDLSLFRNEEQLKKTKKNKKKVSKQKQLSTSESNKRSTSGAVRRRTTGRGSSVSASAVAKAKKAAAIKRTAAVKKVVQAAAAKKHAAAALTTAGSSKRQAATSGVNKTGSVTVASVKKDTKAQPSTGNKRKAASSSSAAPEKRSRRGPTVSQQQTQSSSSNSVATHGKTRGSSGVSSNSNSNSKTLVNSNSSGGTVTSNGNNAAGGTRRTLRNSK